MPPLTKRNNDMSTNRNKDAQEAPRNSFVNPVGSIPEFGMGGSTYREGSSTSQSYFRALGEGGKTRHQGYFSSENPFLNQLRSSSGHNNQDVDALYERAIAWEAENARLQEQRAYDEARLQEQRAYDDPFAQVQRARGAGINLDVQANGGSSGSVSTGSAAQIQSLPANQIEGQTKFSNAYDTTDRVFDGINTASNLVSTFASGFSSIVGAIDTIKTLPSRLDLNTASAGLQSAQANEIKQLLAGKKEGINLSNVAQGIQNSTSTLQQLALFSDLIDPKTVDMAPHLSALGVPQEHIPAYSDFIKQLHANPKMREQYAKAELGAKWSEAENAQFTQELVGRMVSSAIKIKENELAFQEDFSKIQASVQSIISANPTYAQNQAELITTGTQLAKDQQDFAIKQFKRDVSVYTENIEGIKWAIQRTNSKINDIYKKAGEEGRELNPTEKAIIEDHYNTIRQMRVLGSQQVQQLYSLERHAMRLKYFEEDRMSPIVGDVSGLSTLQKHNINSRIIFDDIMTDVATPAELASDVAGKVLTALGIGVAYKATIKTPQSNSNVPDYLDYSDY